MKNYRKKMAMVLAIASLALVAVVGCSKDEEGTSLSDDVLIQPFSLQITPAEPDDSLNQDDPVSDSTSSYIEVTNAEGETVTEYVAVTNAEGQDVTENIEVTDDSGQTVTEYVSVTEADGQGATDANGGAVTTAVAVTKPEVVTTAVVVTKPSGEDPTSDTNSTYVPRISKATAVWINLSKQENLVFNGEFIEMEVTVGADIPDGVYEIAYDNCDFATIDGVSFYPAESLSAKIYVNTDASGETEPTIGSEPMLYADTVSCKQGEKVTLKFYIANNTGMAGMGLHFLFDSNALTIDGCYPIGEYEQYSQGQQFVKAD